MNRVEMRRLRDFQAVMLVVGEQHAACRVVAVEGDTAILQPEDARAVVAQPTATKATLSFETARHPVLLTGLAGDGPLPGTLAFTAADAASAQQRRLASRLPLEVPVRVLPEGGLVVAARTVDIAGGGVRISRWMAPVGTRARIELSLPGTDERLERSVRVVRTLPDGCAATFDDADDAEAGEALGQFVLTCRQIVAQRAADRRRAA